PCSRYPALVGCGDPEARAAAADRRTAGEQSHCRRQPTVTGQGRQERVDRWHDVQRRGGRERLRPDWPRSVPHPRGAASLATVAGEATNGDSERQQANRLLLKNLF